MSEINRANPVPPILAGLRRAGGGWGEARRERVDLASTGGDAVGPQRRRLERLRQQASCSAVQSPTPGARIGARSALRRNRNPTGGGDVGPGGAGLQRWS